VKRYLETSLELMKKEGRDVESGVGSQIEPGADVRDSVIWEGVRVSEGATVRNAVLGAGVFVRSGERIENAAVVRAELVEGVERPPKGLAGEVRGANFVAPLPE
jgi:NDP-sugar pyrophosphorylase family protein